MIDRKVFAACALLAAPVALGPGCDAQPAAEPPAAAPLVLAELQQLSPGPWRQGPRHAIAPASLDRPAPADFGAQPSTLDPAQVNELKLRMHGDSEAPAGEAEPVAPYGEQSALPPYDMKFSDPAAASPDTTVMPPESAQPAAEATAELELPGVPGRKDSTVLEPNPGTWDAPPHVLAPQPVPQTVDNRRLPDAAMTIPAEQTPLPWASGSVLTAEMAAVLDEAEQRIREGFRLAARDALYLAKEELIGALELIAQAHDMQLGTQFHTESLDAGLLALEESREFTRPRPVGKRLDLDRIVTAHRTPVLKNTALEKMPPAEAARRYYAYAQEQLAGAASGEARSSIALYGLAKIIAANHLTSPAERLEGTARAMVLHQAALMADRNNYRAANELGVILARKGDLVHARDLLSHSLRLAPHPVPYRNLAIVLANLDEPQLAERAMGEAVALEQRGIHRSGPMVEWVDPATFASRMPASNTSLPPVAQTTPAETAPAEKENVSTARKGIDWPWTRR